MSARNAEIVTNNPSTNWEWANHEKQESALLMFDQKGQGFVRFLFLEEPPEE